MVTLNYSAKTDFTNKHFLRTVDQTCLQCLFKFDQVLICFSFNYCVKRNVKKGPLSVPVTYRNRIL